MSDVAPNAQADPVHSDEGTVQLALAAAEAIKRLVAERNALRSRLTSREHELTRLREHVALIRDSYRKLADDLITQLKLVDSFDSEASQKTAGPEEFPRFLWSGQQKAS
jgi:hypothetical protein